MGKVTPIRFDHLPELEPGPTEERPELSMLSGPDTIEAFGQINELVEQKFTNFWKQRRHTGAFSDAEEFENLTRLKLSIYTKIIVNITDPTILSADGFPSATIRQTNRTGEKSMRHINNSAELSNLVYSLRNDPDVKKNTLDALQEQGNPVLHMIHTMERYRPDDISEANINATTAANNHALVGIGGTAVRRVIKSFL